MDSGAAEAGFLLPADPTLGQEQAMTLGRRGNKSHTDLDGFGAYVAGPEIAAPLTKGSAAGKGVSQPERRQEDDENLVAHERPDAEGPDCLTPWDGQSLRVTDGKG